MRSNKSDCMIETTIIKSLDLLLLTKYLPPHSQFYFYTMLHIQIPLTWIIKITKKRLIPSVHGDASGSSNLY